MGSQISSETQAVPVNFERSYLVPERSLLIAAAVCFLFAVFAQIQFLAHAPMVYEAQVFLYGLYACTGFALVCYIALQVLKKINGLP